MRHIEPNHPHPEKGQIRVYEEGESIPDIRSSKQGSIKDVTYFELENLLGEPTYPNQSADEKVQKEWVIEFTPSSPLQEDPYLLRIYDWKTYSLWDTTNVLRTWSIGGENESGIVAMELESLLKTLIKMNKI
tara:strand:- start:9396 stop:9791 length:396 start_codon:yes stop_codon:yes gene_type:complete